jgi:hypothetical protein
MVMDHVPEVASEDREAASRSVCYPKGISVVIPTKGDCGLVGDLLASDKVRYLSHICIGSPQVG